MSVVVLRELPLPSIFEKKKKNKAYNIKKKKMKDQVLP